MTKMELVAGGASIPVEVDEENGKHRVWLAGTEATFDSVGGERGDGKPWSIVVDGRQYEVQASLEDGRVLVEVDGQRYVFERQQARAGEVSARSQAGSAAVVAPMPGKVVKLLAAPGDFVEAHQGILLFEAMKMQNEIRSPLAGELVSVFVREGQAVESRERLFTVRATAPPG